MSSYLAAWFAAFACTVVVELMVATPLLAPSGAPWPRRAGVVVLANLASHPLVWFAFPHADFSAAVRLAAAESFALLAETATYLLVWPAIGPARAFGTSALANGASLAVGLSLRAFGIRI